MMRSRHRSSKKRTASAFPRSFEVNVAISTTTPSGTAEPRKYKVLSKGNDNTVVMTVEPAAERGQIMLMKGHDLWVFLPTVSQPVRLPASQGLPVSSPTEIWRGRILLETTSLGWSARKRSTAKRCTSSS